MNLEDAKKKGYVRVSGAEVGHLQYLLLERASDGEALIFVAETVSAVDHARGVRPYWVQYARFDSIEAPGFDGSGKIPTVRSFYEELVKTGEAEVAAARARETAEAEARRARRDARNGKKAPVKPLRDNAEPFQQLHDAEGL